MANQLLHWPELVFGEEVEDCRVCLAVFFVRELAVSSTLDGEKLVGNSEFVECLVQP